jgi:hypothetical protein
VEGQHSADDCPGPVPFTLCIIVCLTSHVFYTSGELQTLSFEKLPNPEVVCFYRKISTSVPLNLLLKHSFTYKQRPYSKNNKTLRKGVTNLRTAERLFCF